MRPLDDGEARELLTRSAHRRASTGFRIGVDQDELERVFEEGRAVLERLEDWTTLTALTAAYAQATQTTGDVRRYYELTHESRRLAARTNDPSIRATAEVECSWSEIMKGELRQAFESADRGLEWIGTHRNRGETPAGYDPYPTCLMVWTAAAAYLGRLQQCPPKIEEMLAIVREGPIVETLMWGLGFQIFYLEILGDADVAVEAASELRRVAERCDSLHGLISGRGWVGMAYCLAERWEDAVAELREAQRLSDKHDVARDTLQLPLAHLAEAELRSLGPERALETVSGIISRCETWGAGFFGMRNQLAKTRILLELGGSALADAEETPHRAETAAKKMNAAGFFPHFQMERAQIARLRGNDVRYRELVEEAVAMWRKMGAKGWAARHS